MPYSVYILTNYSRTTLYIGVTNNLARRLVEHRQGFASSFTRKYRVDTLIYYETTDDVWAALEREKQLKGWTRAKKEALIATANPHWADLGGLVDETAAVFPGLATPDRGRTAPTPFPLSS